MNKYLIIALCVLVPLTWASVEVNAVRKKRIQTLETDLQAAQTLAGQAQATATYYINQHGQQVTENKVLRMTADNLRKLSNTNALAFVHQFEGVKKDLRNLQQAMTIQAEVNASLKLHLRDTVVYRKLSSGGTDTVRARRFGYHDAYNTLKGHLIGDTTYIDSLKMQIPLYGIVRTGRRTKKFLFVRYGPREVISNITTPNPWGSISNQLIIQIN